MILTIRNRTHTGIQYIDPIWPKENVNHRRLGVVINVLGWIVISPVVVWLVTKM